MYTPDYNNRQVYKYKTRIASIAQESSGEKEVG